MRSFHGQKNNSARRVASFRKAGLAISAATGFVGLCSRQAGAAGVADTWKNVGTNFNLGTDWVTGNLPGTADGAIFSTYTSSGSTFQPQLTANISIGSIDFATNGYDLTSTGGAVLTLIIPSSTGNAARAEAGVTGTIDAPINLGAAVGVTQNFQNASGGSLTINGVISSTNSIIFTLNSSNFTLKGANTYTGPTDVANTTAANIYVASTTAFSSGLVTLGLTGKATLTPEINLTGGAKLMNAFAAGNDFTLANYSITPANGIEFGSAFDLGAPVSTPRTITDSVTGGATFDGVISDDNGQGVALVTSNSSVVTFAGANTYTGQTTISGTGKLSVSTIGTSSAAGGLGQTNAAINLGAATSGGSILYTGSTASTSRTFNLAGTTGGGTIDTTGAGGSLTLSSFSVTGAGAKTLTLTGDTLNDTFTASIVDSSGGATALTKLGTGSWVLTSANTYTGLTTVTAGTLALGSGGSINSGNNLTTAAGGTFDIAGNAQTLGLLTNAGEVVNNGSAALLTIGNGSTGAGTFTGSGLSLTWNQGATTSSLTGSMTFTGNLTTNANSTGNLTVATANNTGAITNSGTGTGTATFSGIIGTNVSSVTQLSASSVLALNASNTFAGGLTVARGTVSSNTAVTGGLGAGAVLLGNTASPNTDNATLLYLGSGTAVANPITVEAGSTGILALEGQSNGNSFTGAITENNALTLANLTAAKATSFTGVITGSSPISIGNSGITNAGVVTLSGADSTSFTGGITVNSGELDVDGAGALGSGALAVDGGALGSSGITTDTNNAVTFNGDFNYATSGGLNLGMSAVSLGTLTSGTVRTVTFASTGELTLGGVVSNGTGTANGVTTLAKSGTGILVLANSGNTFSNLTVNGGTVYFTPAATSGGAVTTATSIGTAFGTGQITLNGGGLQFDASTYNGSNPGFTALTNAINLTADSFITPGGGQKRYTLLSGLISGANKLTLNLTASNGNPTGVFVQDTNTYAGGTDLNTVNGTGAGLQTLFVANATNALGGGSGGIGGTLRFVDNSNTATQGNSFLVLAADQTIAGLTQVITGTGNTGANNYVAGSSTSTAFNLIINNTNGGTGDGSSFAGTIGTSLLGTLSGSPITGGAAAGNNIQVQKQGSGTQILSGNNTFTGPVTIGGGTLTIDATTNASASLAGTSTISIAGGATLKLLNSAAIGNTSMINDSAVLYLSDAVGNPMVELDLGAVTNAETVFGLLLDNVPQPSGYYSSTSVPAGSTVPTSDFTGSGELFVSSSATPEPSSLGLLAMGVGGLTLTRRRRKPALAAHTEGGK